MSTVDSNRQRKKPISVDESQKIVDESVQRFPEENG